MRTQSPKIKRRVPETVRKRNFIGIRINDEELSSLEAIAEREHVSLAFVVREAIQMFIREKLKS